MQNNPVMQLEELGNLISTIQYAIDSGKPLATKRFARKLARVVYFERTFFPNMRIWNTVSGLDAYTQYGCYPIFYLDKWSSVLCSKCATKALSDSDEMRRPVHFDINFEDNFLICEDCNTQIESAYGEN